MSWQAIKEKYNLSMAEVFLSKTRQRLDAEFYDPQYLFLDTVLETKNKDILGNLTEKIDVGYVGSMVSEYNTEGVLLLQTRNVKAFFVNTNECQKINEDFHKKLKKSQVHKNDIVIARSGSFGTASVYLDDAVVNSSDIIIIRSKSEINPFYLTTFINSKYGSFQLMRFASGGLQGHINLTILEELKITLPTKVIQEKIQDIVLMAYEKKVKGEKLHLEAKRILLEELGLEKHTPSELSVSVRDLAECLRDDRFDAEYWQPEYDAMEKAVSKVTQKELGEIVSVSKGVEVGSEAYDPEGKPFIRVSDFSIYGIEDVEKKISLKLYEELKDKYTPKKGEVLFTKDGTIGLSYALHEDIIGILSGAFLRLKPTIKINTDYLALVLNSLYCKTQIERMSGGAIIAHLKPESAKKIKIPLLSDAKQAEIAEKVSTAFRMRKEAKELLEKAKRAVEIFVEKDEKEALNYLNNHI